MVARPPPSALTQRMSRLLSAGLVLGWVAAAVAAATAGAGVDLAGPSAGIGRGDAGALTGAVVVGEVRQAGCRTGDNDAAAAAARVSMLKLKAGPSSDIRSTSPDRIRVRPETTVWLTSKSPVPVEETLQPSSVRQNRAERPLAGESCFGSKNTSQLAWLPTRNSAVSKTIRSPARAPDRMKISALMVKRVSGNQATPDS